MPQLVGQRVSIDCLFFSHSPSFAHDAQLSSLSLHSNWQMPHETGHAPIMYSLFLPEQCLLFAQLAQSRWRSLHTPFASAAAKQATSASTTSFISTSEAVP